MAAYARTAYIPRSANGKGGLDPSRRDLRTTTFRLTARLLPGRPRGIVRFAEAVCRLGYAPIAAQSATWRTVPLAVHLPARYGILRSVALRTRCSALGPGFPDRRQGCPLAHPASRTTGFPDNGRSAAAYTELLRRAQDMPWTSGWPRQMPPHETWDGAYMGVTVHP